MKSAFQRIVICTIAAVILLPASAYANSSWHWVTVSPMTVFPLAVLFTLSVEVLAVKKFAKVDNTKRAILVIGLANLLSFLAPYLERAYRFMAVTGGFYLSAAFNKGPYYIIFAGSLLLTVIVELPVVYFLLRKNTENQRKLILSIIASNIVTTIIVAVLERLICIGQW
jgi:hypothetical protein